jgi:hypothetical protein
VLGAAATSGARGRQRHRGGRCPAQLIAIETARGDSDLWLGSGSKARWLRGRAARRLHRRVRGSRSTSVVCRFGGQEPLAVQPRRVATPCSRDHGTLRTSVRSWRARWPRVSPSMWCREAAAGQWCAWAAGAPPRCTAHRHSRARRPFNGTNGQDRVPSARSERPHPPARQLRSRTHTRRRTRTDLTPPGWASTAATPHRGRLWQQDAERAVRSCGGPS